MRILAVIESLPSRGAERALADLATALKAKGHIFEIAALWAPYELEHELYARGVRVHRLDVGDRRNLIESASRLTRLVRWFRPHLLHAHLPLAALAAAATPRRGIPKVVTFHSLGYDSYPVDSAWRVLRRAVERAAMSRRIDAHVAVSQAVAAHIAEHLHLRALRVIPNGVDIGELVAEASRQTAPAEPYMLCAGTLRPEKGHSFLLEALANLDPCSVPPLVIAGEGQLRDEIERTICRLGLTDRVRLVGALPHGRLMTLIAGAQFVVMPSMHEGLPIALLETMALGRPLIASRVGGIPEAVQDGTSGVLVNAGEVGELADALRTIAADADQRRRLAAAASERARSLFSVDATAAGHLRLYRQLLERPGPTTRPDLDP